eukprot:1968759-Lingulodinium_polyedra.AAC.1
MLLAAAPRGLMLCLTTTSDGSNFGWLVAPLGRGGFRAPVYDGAARRAPVGVPPGAVNWMCRPPGAGEQWSPADGDLVAFQIEAAPLM